MHTNREMDSKSLITTSTIDCSIRKFEDSLTILGYSFLILILKALF